MPEHSHRCRFNVDFRACAELGEAFAGMTLHPTSTRIISAKGNCSKTIGFVTITITILITITAGKAIVIKIMIVIVIKIASTLGAVIAKVGILWFWIQLRRMNRSI